MNFKVCFNCKRMTWFDIIFTFFKIKVPKENNLNYQKLNIQNGDYLVDFRTNIYCNHVEGELNHIRLKDTSRLLNEFYFHYPELLKYAILKKEQIRKNKIYLENEMYQTVSLYFKKENNKFYYCAETENEFLNNFLLDYFKYLETNMFPFSSCPLNFEHVVFGKELK